MAIVKQISFKEKEKAIFEFANDRGNFSEYIKQLIREDMAAETPIREKGTIPMLKGNVMLLGQQPEEAEASEFILEAERDDLEL